VKDVVAIPDIEELESIGMGANYLGDLEGVFVLVG